MELSLLVITFAIFYSNCNAITWENRITEVNVTGSWQMILDHDNDNSQPATYSRKLTRGFKSTEQKTNVVRTTHKVGTAIEAESVFKIVDVTASINYEYTHTTEVVTMTSWELTHSEEVTSTAVIPPRSRLVRWQLVANVGGHDIGFLKVIDSLNSSVVPPSADASVTVRVVLPRKIEVCDTPFRIKHRSTEKYITVTTRKNWPAATLGWSSTYYFEICTTSRQNKFRVLTLNTTHANYNIMYSSDQGGIYFDRANSGIEPKDLWELNKSLPLRDNDVITFRNVFWPTAYLCYHQGPATSVYCLNQQEDQWMLEM